MTNLLRNDGAQQRLDPVASYEQQRKALLAADTQGYVDPHFTDVEKDPDAELPADARDERTEDGDTGSVAPEQGVVEVAPDADQQAEGGAEGQQPAAKAPWFRIRPRNELDTRAAMLLKANPEMSFDEALKQARQELGVSDPCVKDDTPSNNVSTSSGEAVDDTLSPNTMATDDGEAMARADHPMHHAYKHSASQAAALLPQHPVDREEFLGRMALLDHLLGKTQDPLYGHPNKPMVLAQMAARDMRLARLKPSQAQAEPGLRGVMTPMTVYPEAARPAPARMTAPLAGGSASTNTSRGKLDRAIGDIRSPEDYQRLVGALLRRK